MTIKIKKYLVRNDCINAVFESDEVSLVAVNGASIEVMQERVLGVFWYSFILPADVFPLDFSDDFYVMVHGEWHDVELAEGVVPIYFKTLKEYEASGYMWGANRHSDPETNAFICGQLIEHTDLPVHVKFSLSVINGYKALELQREDMLLRAEALIESLLPLEYRMNDRPSVRENRYHLIFSAGYVLQLIYILRREFDKLGLLWVWLSGFFSEIYSKKIVRISLINIVNILVLMSVYAYKSGVDQGKNIFVKASLVFFRRSVSLFDGNFDIVHLKELSVPQKTVALHQVLGRIDCDEYDFSPSIKNHFKVDSVEDYFRKLILSSLRTKGEVNTKIINVLLEVDGHGETCFFEKIQRDLRAIFDGSVSQISVEGGVANVKSDHAKDKVSKGIYVDLIRDLALKYEQLGKISTAFDLMQAAHELRPHGPLIKKKLNEYQCYLMDEEFSLPNTKSKENSGD